MTDGPDWVEQARRLVAGLGQTLGEAARTGAQPDAEGAGHPADCRWCPVCQVAAVVRGERPEVTAALADALTAAAAALRSFAEQSPAAPPAPADGSPTAPPAEEPPAAPEAAAPEPVTPEPAPVQRIEIA
ncbi:hypothetical protein [Geodermatophilus sp. SYSU D00079]